MKLNRRDVAKGAMLAAGLLGAGSQADAYTKSTKRQAGPTPDPEAGFWKKPKGNEYIAMVAYPGMTALDLYAPHYYFATMRGARVHIVAETRAPLLCDRNCTIVPDATYADVPANPDLIFVPGGGVPTVDAMENDALIDFLADRAKGARFVGSICTGALILGAAGLLQGKRATAHWKVRDACLPAMGATPVNQRIVQDGKVVTGGGVTAGVDFGIYMTNIFRGPDYARTLQLISEYQPEPLYNSGTPEAAPAGIANFVTGLLPGYNERAARIGNRKKA